MNNKNRLDKVHSSALWKSIGIPLQQIPIVGRAPIHINQAGDNPNARAVYCLGCNNIILPQSDCWCLEYKGYYRYVCRDCYVTHGFIW